VIAKAAQPPNAESHFEFCTLGGNSGRTVIWSSHLLRITGCFVFQNAAVSVVWSDSQSITLSNCFFSNNSPFPGGPLLSSWRVRTVK
jgi:hypothetical protein